MRSIIKKITSLLLPIGYFALSNAQNPLNIPPTLSGTTFNLNIQPGSQTFYTGKSTPTYGINGTWMAPTIIVNSGDSITLNVKNSLPVKTTIHWHGLHVAAKNDGGPHQIILPNATWSPSFKVRNNASTFWYHPHGHGQTDPHVSKGIAGLFIVRDSTESKLALPRTYGVDDVPIIVQSKAFDDLQQIAIATDMDTALFVNGTLYPYFDAPAQVLRLRLLNGSSLRSYNFGFSGNQTFYQIGTDGGLLDTPRNLQRLILSPGERAEILVNFTGLNGQSLALMSYASELPFGIYGSDSMGNADNQIHEYEDNFLNGTDFSLLKFNIVSPTAGAIYTTPNSLVPITPFNLTDAKVNRRIVFDTIRLLPADVPNLAEGPFGFNKRTFDMDSINEVVHINTTETWTLINRTLTAHPFHIHDIQFNVVEESGIPVPAKQRGWKDVVLVMPNDSLKFITKFSTFSDPMVPYMYHCHLLHHEDDGMMGSFLVIDTNSVGIRKIQKSSALSIYPNPSEDFIEIQSPNSIEDAEITIINPIGVSLFAGRLVNNQVRVSGLPAGVYFIRIEKNKQIFMGKFMKI